MADGHALCVLVGALSRSPDAGRHRALDGPSARPQSGASRRAPGRPEAADASAFPRSVLALPAAHTRASERPDGHGPSTRPNALPSAAGANALSRTACRGVAPEGSSTPAQTMTPAGHPVGIRPGPSRTECLDKKDAESS